jgi:dienelactone hydrolase
MGLIARSVAAPAERIGFPRRAPVAIAVCVALAWLPRPASANEDRCGKGVRPKLVHYLETSAKLGDQRCDRPQPGTLPTGIECKVDLQGVLYAPPGGGRHPVVLFNHGSSGHDYCDVAKVFTNHGYLFFVPFRRGHSGDVWVAPNKMQDVRSTGVYAVDVLEQIEADDRRLKNISVGPLLESAMPDVRAALEFVKRLPNADPRKVAVAGHSFGGMTALIAAADVEGFKAALDISGGCLSWWLNPDLQAYLKNVAKRARIPVFAFQDDQECSGEDPTRTLGALLPAGSQKRIYHMPKMDCHEAHSQFLYEGEYQALWREDARDFLAVHGVAP